MPYKTKPSFWRKATDHISSQVHTLTTNAESTLKEAKKTIISTQNSVTKIAQTSAEMTQSTIESAQSSLTEATQRATEVVTTSFDQASSSFNSLQEESVELFKKVHTQVGESTDQILAQANQVTQVTQEHLGEIAHSTKNQALKTSKQVDLAVKKANQTVADGIDDLVGNRGQPVSNFVRTGGLLTIAGVAFRPIAIARRGVDNFRSYQAFMRGEIALGILLLEVVAPGASDAKAYLADPQNQTEILQVMRKVIPDAVIEKSLGLSSSLSDQLNQTVSGQSLSGVTLGKFQNLLEYKRPQGELNEEIVAHEEAEQSNHTQKQANNEPEPRTKAIESSMLDVT
jgi:ElaB/YqjD/DUF883 family membrane-anchored ribosome-binding protein